MQNPTGPASDRKSKKAKLEHPAEQPPLDELAYVASSSDADAEEGKLAARRLDEQQRAPNNPAAQPGLVVKPSADKDKAYKRRLKDEEYERRLYAVAFPRPIGGVLDFSVLVGGVLLREDVGQSEQSYSTGSAELLQQDDVAPPQEEELGAVSSRANTEHTAGLHLQNPE